MKIHDGFTPKQYAYAKTLDCIRSMHGEQYGMYDGLTPTQVKEVQQQLAVLHNKLLDNSNLDSIAL